MVKKNKGRSLSGRRSALAISKGTTRHSSPVTNSKEGFYFPPLEKDKPSNDPLIIQAMILNIEVQRDYLDSGSECDVIFEHCFLKLPEALRARRTDPRGPLVGFFGEHAWPLGELDLDVTIKDGAYERTETLDLSIVRSPSPYNILLGRTVIQKMEMVPSVIHELVKF
uniref:uncharacterized protein LOC122591771 n=1 Tax=Erigeron canadensis TaxID=72917 RepID=UPI001CB8E7D3|nr:uncharacterized protein LOC122591771 [Erigeron canadensis]